jgi:hypothetical protein
MTRLMLILVTALSFRVSASSQTTQPTTAPTPAPAEWAPLMNGKDFTGWYTFLRGPGRNNDPDHVFQIEPDGVVHIYKDAPDGAEQPFGYFSTERDYADCRIRFEYKWGTKRFGRRATRPRDSGFLYHAFGHDGDQGGVWPWSVECQIQETDVGDIYALGVHVSTTIDPATRDAKLKQFLEASSGGVDFTTPTEPNSRIVRNPMNEHDGWNTIEVDLRGDSAVHIVNGKLNMRIHHITRPDPDDAEKQVPLKQGRVLFQAEGAEVMYRNIEVRALDTK